MDKKQIRQNIVELRASLSPENHSAYSHMIRSILIESKPFKNASHIASFVDFRNEVRMSPINDYILEMGKSLYLPYIDMKNKKMTFLKVNALSELQLSHYGILEPNPEIHKPIDISEIDLVLTPGVAFDYNGFRLGYGGGFYDRFFEQLEAQIPRVGIAFSLQQRPMIPVESHDIPLTALVTEKGIQWF